MPNQISQGIEALEAIETAINRSRTTKKKMIELSNDFYQAIPIHLQMLQVWQYAKLVELERKQ